MKIKLLFALFLFSLSSFAQADSCKLRISLLTCSPGEELYSAFGHSALRVTDSAYGTDLIFNYGSFNFDDPDFYEKFVRGKLLYFVSVERFQDFVYAYQYEKRGVEEQVLNLDCAEKEKLFAALRENAKEENKYYRYDFLFDNCSSRLRDIVERNMNSPVTYRRIVNTPPPTFRNLIHEYLDRGGQDWSKFGIDLLLGSRIDRPVENREAMFLPDYLMKGFDSAAGMSKTLVLSKGVILPPRNYGEKTATSAPFLVFLILFLAAGILSVVKSPLVQRGLFAFDFLLFLLTGLLGIVLLFMWFGTDHAVCRANFNMLWALPTHLIAACFLYSRKRWVSIYLLITSIIAGILLVSWKWLPQEFNIAFLPIVATILVRSFFHSRLMRK